MKLFLSLCRRSASRICEANRGTLATIPDSPTYDKVAGKYAAYGDGKGMWIGGSDRLREGHWLWVTGQVGTIFAP